MVVKPPLTKMEGSWVVVQTPICYENKIIETNEDVANRNNQIDTGVSNRWNPSNSKIDKTIKIHAE